MVFSLQAGQRVQRTSQSNLPKLVGLVCTPAIKRFGRLIVHIAIGQSSGIKCFSKCIDVARGDTLANEVENKPDRRSPRHGVLRRIMRADQELPKDGLLLRS